MKFKNLDNGSVYDVIAEDQIPFYENNPHFEKVVEKATKKESTEKKTKN